MTRKPEIAFGAWDEALTNVVFDIGRSLNLPSEITNSIQQMRLSMLQHQDKLPKIGRAILVILESSSTIEKKVVDIIESVGLLLGWTRFDINIQVGAAESRIERLKKQRPDLYAALPMAIERGKRELKKLT